MKVLIISMNTGKLKTRPEPLGGVDRWCFVVTAFGRSRTISKLELYGESIEAAVNSIFPVQQPELQTKQTQNLIIL